MPIKQEHTAFRAEGYRAWGRKDKQERVVSLYLNSGRGHIEVEFTLDEAKQIIDEIKTAIKQSKKKMQPLHF